MLALRWLASLDPEVARDAALRRFLEVPTQSSPSLSLGGLYGVLSTVEAAWSAALGSLTQRLQLESEVACLLVNLIHAMFSLNATCSPLFRGLSTCLHLSKLMISPLVLVSTYHWPVTWGIFPVATNRSC